jgi:hypothetical protein
MVVKDPVDPTIVADTVPTLIPDASTQRIKPGVMSIISGPMSSETSKVSQYICSSDMFYLPGVF